MNSRQLVQFLLEDAHTRTAFQGVYPIDRLPEQIYYPCAIVINTDTAEGRGEHWTALFIDCFQVGVYFDSFGLGPRHPSLICFLGRHTKKWSFVNVQIQGVLSTACGLFCIYFLHKQSRGVTVSQLLRPFDRINLLRNDLWVRDWAYEHGRTIFSTRW